MTVVRTVHCVADGPEIRHSKVQSAQVPMYPNLLFSPLCVCMCVCAVVAATWPPRPLLGALIVPSTWTDTTALPCQTLARPPMYGL